MSIAQVFTPEGEKSGSVELPPEIFGIVPSEKALQSSVRAYLTNQRQGTASTKTRSEVKASGAKPWPQKGTGRARTGSVANPIWRGGGVVFGPKPRKFRVKLPQKVRKLALKSALSLKARERKITIIKDFSMPEPKTKKIVQILKNLNLKDGERTLFLRGESDPEITKSFRNIPYFLGRPAEKTCAYEVLNSEQVLISESGLERLKEVFS